MASMHDICPVPNRTIGCQDLVKEVNCVYSGWLRRQSLRNKLKIFAWPHVYVAIAGGCVYCYGSEVSRRPATAFSLYGYDKVFRAGEVTEKEAPWTFKLVHVNSAYRSHLFSASSEREMAHWMSHMKQEMLRANGKLPKSQTDTVRTPADGSARNSVTYSYQDAGSGSAGSITSQELKEIEANIYEDCSNFILPSDYINQKEEDASDDEMDRVVLTRPDLQERPPLPPPVPRRPGGRKPSDQSGISQAVVDEFKQLNVANKSSQQESKVPTVDRTAKPLQKRGDPDGSSAKAEQDGKNDRESVDASDFWSSIYFYGGKEMANDIISRIADDGVFLVRVNEDKSKVLHVYGNQQARKFIIFNYDKKYGLDKNLPHFDRVVDMIYHYYQNPLPRVDILLNECYLHHPKYKTL